MSFKAKIPQFEYGEDVQKNLYNSLNIYIDCRQITVEHDGESEFSTVGWPIPNKDVDWRTIKMTVNGSSFFEGHSFERTDDGILTWIDPNFKLQKNDVVFVEYTVDSNNYDGYSIEELEGMLYIVVHNYLVTVEQKNVRYPLIIEVGKDGDIKYYIMKDGYKVYFIIDSEGKVKEVKP